MIKRTNSFEMKERKSSKVMSQSGQNLDHVNEDAEEERDKVPQSIQMKQISGIKLQKKQSSNKEPSLRGSRGKIPAGILNSIKTIASGKKPQMGKSKFGNLMKSKFREVRDIMFLCQICEMEYKDQEKTFITKCGHFFCDSCLQHYVIYKVGMFEEVVCPNEECDETMDMESKFFGELPSDIQKKYSKLHAFYVTSKDPNLRLCPSQKCEDGILKLNEGQEQITCPKCNQTFCAKCFFAKHEGPCDQNEVDFFENNLHYRQCKNCKNVIERSQGCNHMTCRCGYQFCYVCGVKWRENHLCNRNVRVRNNNNTENNDDRYCEQLCACLNRQGCIFSVIKFIYIILICFPIYILIVSIMTIKYLLITVLQFIFALFAGMLSYTGTIICEQNQCPLSALLLICCPLVMFAGIKRSLQQVFYQFNLYYLEQFKQVIVVAFQCILCW